MSEELTTEERDGVEELPGRQSGCPDPTCNVCRANARRAAALAKLLRLYDAQAAALERVRAHVRASGGSCQGAMILALASTESTEPKGAP